MSEVSNRRFVHFDGTKQEFIDGGYPDQYQESIVFINGDGNESNNMIYTHGEYYGQGVIVEGDASNSAVLKGEYNGYSNKAISVTSMAVGAGTTSGLKGWYYSKIDFSTKKITLSDNQPTVLINNLIGGRWESGVPNIKKDDIISIVNDSKYDLCSKVVDIDKNIITVDTLPFDKLETSLIAINNLDDWSVYIPDKPDAGIIDFGGGAFSEGGYNTMATNICAHAEGLDTHAYGQYSHAEGRETKAGYASHAEGRGTKAIGEMSHAEGLRTTVIGAAGHAEGADTSAGQKAHAEGSGCEATGYASHAEGGSSKSFGQYSHAEGKECETHANNSHAEGSGSKATGQAAHAEGVRTEAGYVAHSEGYETKALGRYSHAEGNATYVGTEDKEVTSAVDTTELGYSAHAEGQSTVAIGNSSHTEGLRTKTLGTASHAEGADTVASGQKSHAEGAASKSIGYASHAEGVSTESHGLDSHSEGSNTKAYGNHSHAEGANCQARGIASHAEGVRCKTYNTAGHAEGYETKVGEYFETFSKATYFKCYMPDYDNERYTLIWLTGKQTKPNKTTTIYTDGYVAPFKIGDKMLMILHDDSGKRYEYIYTIKGVDRNVIEIDYDTTLCESIYHGIIADSQSFSIINLTTGEGKSKIDTFVYGDTENIYSGIYSHAEGYQSRAIGNTSHAEGYQSNAMGDYSHCSGYNTVTTNRCEFACGEYNNSENGTLFSVGCGDDTKRSNIFEINEFKGVYIKIDNVDYYNDYYININDLKKYLPIYNNNKNDIYGVKADESGVMYTLSIPDLGFPIIYEWCHFGDIWKVLIPRPDMLTGNNVIIRYDYYLYANYEYKLADYGPGGFLNIEFNDDTGTEYINRLYDYNYPTFYDGEYNKNNNNKIRGSLT